MYDVFVPFINKIHTVRDIQSFVTEMKKCNICDVFLIFNRVLNSDEGLMAEKDLFLHNKSMLEAEGLTVHAWLVPTVGYGGTGENPVDNKAPYTKLQFLKGNDVFAYCPLDGDFVEGFLKTLKTLCSTGVKKILFEDDFTLSGGKVLSDLACCCPRHMELLEKSWGEKLDRKDLRKIILEGKPNIYRKKWLEIQGKTLLDFAEKIEKEIHGEYPDVRIGLSANASSYEIEGVEFAELVKAISGNLKPFVRLTGAPYWKNAFTQGANVEAIRLQTRWLKNLDADLMTESDGLPHVRHWMPSCYYEFYDTILRADGGSNGILKYLTDYASSVTYEDSYFKAHKRSEKLYDEIEKRFGGKKAVGLNVFEKTFLLEEREFGVDITFEDLADRNGYLPTVSQWMIIDNCLPVCYDGKNCASLVFGDNAKFVTEEMLKNGVVLDAQAAKILLEKGIDIGVRSYKNGTKYNFEYFADADEITCCTTEKNAVFYDFELDNGAKVLSEFVVTETGMAGTSYGDPRTQPKTPACWIYENKEGQRFMVYSFVAPTVIVVSGWTYGLFRNYLRQKQLYDGIKWLQKGKPLPAMTFGNPELYTLCKKDESSMAVGLWNYFADKVYDCEIFLDDIYSEVDFYNCNGELRGNKVVLNSVIHGYDYAFFTVKK